MGLGGESAEALADVDAADAEPAVEVEADAAADVDTEVAAVAHADAAGLLRSDAVLTDPVLGRRVGAGGRGVGGVAGAGLLAAAGHGVSLVHTSRTIRDYIYYSKKVLKSQYAHGCNQARKELRRMPLVDRAQNYFILKLKSLSRHLQLLMEVEMPKEA